MRAVQFRTKAMAFLVRSLRQESRLLTHHLLRCLLATFVLGMLAVQVATATLRASSGGAFASKTLTTCYWFITLLGGVYFSSAIVEEKEEQTLPLLRMTGAGPVAILLGKSIPRLVSVFLFLCCISPFLFLAITLGGAVVDAIAQTIVAILIYAIMISQIGLLGGLLSRNGERAFSKTIIMWLVVEFFPSLCWVFSQLMLAWTGFRSIAEADELLEEAKRWNESSLDFASDEVVPTGTLVASWLASKLSTLSAFTEDWVLCNNLSITSMGFSSATFWTHQMTFHLCVASVAFLVSWLLFEPFTRHAVANSNVAPSKKLTRRVRRSWDQALAWKVWQFQTGGQFWFWMRLIAAPAFVTAVGATVMWAIDEPIEADVIGMILFIGGIPMLFGHLSVLFGRIFGSEVYERTLSTLLMLPVSRNRLLVDSVRGLIPGILSASTTVVIGLAVLWQSGAFDWDYVYEVLIEPWTWAILLLWIVATYSGVLFSLRMRYGGMLLAILGVFLVLPYCLVLAIFAIGAYFVGWRGANQFIESGLPLILLQIEIPLCIWLHFRILKALNRAGETS